MPDSATIDSGALIYSVRCASRTIFICTAFCITNMTKTLSSRKSVWIYLDSHVWNIYHHCAADRIRAKEGRVRRRNGRKWEIKEEERIREEHISWHSDLVSTKTPFRHTLRGFVYQRLCSFCFFFFPSHDLDELLILFLVLSLNAYNTCNKMFMWNSLNTFQPYFAKIINLWTASNLWTEKNMKSRNTRQKCENQKGLKKRCTHTYTHILVCFFIPLLLVIWFR